MLLQFITMYVKELEHASSLSLDTEMWEVRPSRIAIHYIKGWFVVDFLSIFPSVVEVVELIAKSLQQPEVGGDLARACSGDGETGALLKGIRFIRILRLAKPNPNPLSLSLA